MGGRLFFMGSRLFFMGGRLFFMGSRLFSWGDVLFFLTSSLVRYFYLPRDGTCDFKGVSEDLTGDAG